MEQVDIVVIGLGAIGSGALRHLAVAGVDVVGVGSPEPADFSAHDGVFASHYDSGRVTRHIDPTFEWAELARRAIAQYPVIAADGGVEFHRPVGVVYASGDDHEVAALEQVRSRLAALGVEVERTSECDDPRVAVPTGLAVFHEGAPAGHIDPRRLMTAQVRAARGHGATVIEGRVGSLAPRAGGGWTVRLVDGAPIEATTVVVSGGPHSDEIGGLPPMPPLSVRTETIVTGIVGPAERERLRDLPCVLVPVDHPVFADVYLVPPTDYPDGSIRIKLGAGRRLPRLVGTGVARRAWMRGDDHTADLDDLVGLTMGLVPGLVVERWETKPCLITDTPSGLPYVDHLADGLVLAAGCNGYAAKSGDAIGAMAARLALDGTWSDTALAADRFAIDRTVVSMRASRGLHIH